MIRGPFQGRHGERLATSAIRQSVTEWNVSQSVAARRLDVTQPRLNDPLRGRIGKSSLDALIVLAARAGVGVRTRIERLAA